MASQHFVVHSSRVIGLGHVQAGAYGCSKQMWTYEGSSQLGPCHQGVHLSVPQVS